MEKMNAVASGVVREAGLSLQAACHSASWNAGWWHHPKTGEPLLNDPKLRNYLVGTKLMLAVSELAEAMEGDRKGLADDKLPHRSMMEVELADCIIRCFDLGGASGFDLGAAIAEKLAYNAQRADHKPAHRAAEGGKAY